MNQAENQNETPEGRGLGVIILKAVLLADDGALMLIPSDGLPLSEELASMYEKIGELAKADAATMRQTIELRNRARNN